MEDKPDVPVFIRIDEYKDIVNILGLIKSKVEEAKSILAKLNQLKNEEDSELEVWHSELEEVERKINFIDKSLMEPASRS